MQVFGSEQTWGRCIEVAHPLGGVDSHACGRIMAASGCAQDAEWQPMVISQDDDLPAHLVPQPATGDGHHAV